MVRKSTDKWEGEIDSQGDYEAFENELYGVRAGLIKLRSFYKKGFITVRMICKYWDSSMSDSQVSEFTSFVERRSQQFADKELTLDNTQMCAVASAITYYYCGESFGLTEEQIASTSRRFNIYSN